MTVKVSHTNMRKQGSASHNDRNFDARRADHIDPDKMDENRYGVGNRRMENFVKKGDVIHTINGRQMAG